MHFNSRAIDGNMVNLDIDDVVFLESAEYPIKYALFGPTVSASIDCVPIAKFLG
jgi:hypothetical protein